MSIKLNGKPIIKPTINKTTPKLIINPTTTSKISLSKNIKIAGSNKQPMIETSVFRLSSIENKSHDEIVNILSIHNWTINELKDLYENYPQLINIYMKSKWLNVIQEEVQVINYNNLQEFYFINDVADKLKQDKVLSYSVIRSNYIRPNLEHPDLVQGFIITTDLPEKSYDYLLHDCTFEIFNAS